MQTFERKCMSGFVMHSPFLWRPFSRRLPCLLCSEWCPCPFPCPCPLSLRVPTRWFSWTWDGLFTLIRALSLSLPGPISSLTGLRPSRPVPSSSGLAKGCRGLWESSPAPALAPRPPCPLRFLLYPRPCRTCERYCRALLPPAEVCACLLLPWGAPCSALYDSARVANSSNILQERAIVCPAQHHLLGGENIFLSAAHNLFCGVFRFDQIFHRSYVEDLYILKNNSFWVSNTSCLSFSTLFYYIICIICIFCIYPE